MKAPILPSKPVIKMHHNFKLVRSFTLLSVSVSTILILCGLLNLQAEVHAAENHQEKWGNPVNLSRSGAASQPRIFSTPAQTFQVFWMDRFDGMMTALFKSQNWSLPAQSLILPPPNRLGVTPTPLTNLPTLLFTDKNGRLNAFYYGTLDPISKTPPLIHSQMNLGSTAWQYGTQVAESASAFTAIQTSDQEIKLFYLRTYKNILTQTSLETEPGLYIRTTTEGATAWGASRILDTSPYYRVITGDQFSLQAASIGKVIILVWNEPRLGRLVSATSPDLGKTWSNPQPLDVPGQPKGLVITNLGSNQLVRIWQDASQSGCVLYQQQYTLNPSTTSVTSPGEWINPTRILEQVDSCPTNNHFLDIGDKVFWLWGEGTDNLYLTAWDAEQASWSLPQRFSFNFQDLETGRYVQLDDLHATLAGEQLGVTGLDRTSGDVWVVTTLISALDLVYAPPSPWTYPQRVSTTNQQASHPTIVIDQQGHTHIVWNQGTTIPGRSLVYARLDGNSLSDTVDIVRVSEREITDQPALLADSQDLLHLVWISGSDGHLAYSRAKIAEAASPSGWAPAKIVSKTPNTVWPQIASDPKGRIFIVYIKQVNEGRGLYLIYSLDHGDSWSQPQLIFDGAAADWISIDHPSLQISPDGNLHIAFVHSNLTGALSSEVHYIRTRFPIAPGSEEQEIEWIEPVLLAENGADWPKLAYISGQLHLLYISSTGFEQRWLPLAEQSIDGLGWRSIARVPEWQELGAALYSQTKTVADALQQSPYALAVDTENIHLIAPIPGEKTLQYSTWSVSQGNPADGVWQIQERYAPLGDWENQIGAAAVAPLTGGKLAIAWLAKSQSSQVDPNVNAAQGIYLSLRTIFDVNPQITPQAYPSSTPSLAPTVIPTDTPQPTATLASSIPSPVRNEKISPYLLGGGLAAFIVVLIFASILLRSKR